MDVATQLALTEMAQTATTHEVTPAQWARLFAVLIAMPAVYVCCPRPVALGMPEDEVGIIDAEITEVTAEAVTITESYDDGEVNTVLHYDAMPFLHLDVYPR